MTHVFTQPELSQAGQVLENLLTQRILVLDGAMGTMIQGFGLEEADFRGALLADHPGSLRGNNELLSLTRPEIIKSIHLDFLKAGADILETNTFGANAVSQGDYSTVAHVRELNLASARLAREAADEITALDPSRPRFVAGAIGPTSKTLSLSEKVEDPSFRAITFDQLKAAYREQIDALIDGGVDTLLVETIFDTLNAKAALVAIEEAFTDLGRRLPVQISVAITDNSGRTLSGQTVGAFWHSVAHANPLSVGVNCSLGAVGHAPPRGGALQDRRTPLYRATPTRACPTPSANTTRPRKSPAPCSRNSPRAASSTSSAVAAARPRPTSKAIAERSSTRSAPRERPNPMRPRGWVSFSGLETLDRRRQTRTTSWWASAQTWPVRSASGA